MLNKLEAFVESLPQGQVLRVIFRVLLYLGAGITVFLGLFFVIDLLLYLPMAHHAAEALGTLLAMLIAIAGILTALFFILTRAKKLSVDPPHSYPIVHLSAQLLRITGEVLAIFHLVAGLSAGIMFWFGGYPRLPYFESWMWRILNFATYPPFLSGLLTILACIFQAAITLATLYLAAEVLMLLRDMSLRSRR